MKNYKLELTENESLKLEMFIIMYKDKLKGEAEAYQKLVEEIQNGNPYGYNDKHLETFKSNQDWFSHTYQVISKIQEKLDGKPF